jgi:hypothetical protein
LPDDIKIFACVPFVLRNDERIHALAVARLEPEETVDDVSLFKLKAGQAMDSKKMEAIFSKHGIKARVLSSAKDIYLIEAQGFIDGQNKALLSIMKETGFAVSSLGAYAVPLKI